MTSVYVSSTYEDLVPFRDAVVRALRKMDKRVVAMEDYVATDRRPVEKCKADVATCDLYIGIFAWRYGYVPEQNNPDKRSITELEYRHAESLGKVCLIFLAKPKGTLWSPEWMDAVTGENDQGKRIIELKDELAKKKTVSMFGSPEELASLVGISVANWEEAQRQSKDAGKAGSEAPSARLRGTDERLRDLDHNIKEALKEIRAAEEAWLVEDDPEHRAKITARITHLRSAWEDYSREYHELEAMGAPAGIESKRAAASLQELDKQLGKLPERERRPGIGLALSGGGFRALLYHLGSLWRLNELGLLGQISEVATVSAGSMIGGFLGLNWQRLEFKEQVATNFVEVIAEPLIAFCDQSIDRSSILLGWLMPRRNPGDILVDKLTGALFADATLQNLPDAPRFTFYATSLQTSASVRFSKEYLAERRLGVIWEPDTPLAKVVGASSASPPFFCPVVVDINPDLWEKTSDADLYHNTELRSHLSLADGSLYDSLALERVWDRYDTVLVSDALQAFRIESRAFGRFIERSRRTFDILVTQSHSLKRRKLIEDFRAGSMAGAYWGIGMRIADFGLESDEHAGPMTSDSESTAALQRLRTRFAPFPPEQKEQLINWGYALTDAALRRYLLPDSSSPKHWPMPKCPL